MSFTAFATRFPSCTSHLLVFFCPLDDDGSGDESGSGCDGPNCDIYFSVPPTSDKEGGGKAAGGKAVGGSAAAGSPRVNPVQSNNSAGVTSRGSMALALCGLALALLAPHLR